MVENRTEPEQGMRVTFKTGRHIWTVTAFDTEWVLLSKGGGGRGFGNRTWRMDRAEFESAAKKVQWL